MAMNNNDNVIHNDEYYLKQIEEQKEYTKQARDEAKQARNTAQQTQQNNKSNLSAYRLTEII